MTVFQNSARENQLNWFPINIFCTKNGFLVICCKQEKSVFDHIQICRVCLSATVRSKLTDDQIPTEKIRYRDALAYEGSKFDVLKVKKKNAVGLFKLEFEISAFIASAAF